MPKYDFSDKVALITGAARGQGREHAIQYARNGADVVVLDICENKDAIPIDFGTREQLDDTVEAVENEGQEALAVEADVSVESDVQNAVDEALEEFGKIDILGNNAAFASFTDLVQMDEREWDDVIDTALKGVWLCSKHVGQHFVERSDGGKIINTASASGMTGVPLGSGHYVAAKHGVIGLTKTLALELAEYDVNVNAVAPTTVNTPAIEQTIEVYGEETLAEGGEAYSGPWNIFDPDDPAIEPRDISEAYLWLSSDAARYVTGIILPVDAGMTAKL